MKFWKHTFVAVAAFLAVSSTVLYTSCEKDGCLDLRCMNGGACTDGFCSCPTGFEGVTCDEFIAGKFLGSFYGETRCVRDTLEFPYIIDTIDIFLRDSAMLTLVQHSQLSDTFYGTVEPTDKNIGSANRYLLIPDDTTQNRVKKVRVELHENHRLTVYTQRTVYTTPDTVKTDCKFIGYR